MECICGMHDRLDLKQQAAEYSAPTCGTLKRNVATGEIDGPPDYCCHNCPTLVALHRG